MKSTFDNIFMYQPLEQFEVVSVVQFLICKVGRFGECWFVLTNFVLYNMLVVLVLIVFILMIQNTIFNQNKITKAALFLYKFVAQIIFEQLGLRGQFFFCIPFFIVYLYFVK